MKRRSDLAAARSVEDFCALAGRWEQDPASTKHADIVRNVFVSAAGVISSVDETRGASLRKIAESIDPQKPLLNSAKQCARSFGNQLRLSSAPRRLERRSKSRRVIVDLTTIRHPPLGAS
jgi:hypothetical protein